VKRDIAASASIAVPLWGARAKSSCGQLSMRRNRRTQPARQRTYIRLYARVDHLEDTISHFYNVINELRRRISTLEKKKSLSQR
jgi:hypothetical protein